MVRPGRTGVIVASILGIVVVGVAVTGGGLSGPESVAQTETDQRGSLQIAGVDAASAVQTADGLAVNVRVRNPGDSPVEDRLVLSLNDGEASSDEPAATRTVRVNGSASRTVTLTIPGGELAPGEYDYEVRTATAGQSVAGSDTVEVTAPSSITLSPETAETSVVHGEDAKVTAVASSEPGTDGLVAVRFALDRDQNGQFSASETETAGLVSLGESEEERTEAVLDTGSLDPGTYSYQFSVNDERARGRLVVQQPATFELANLTAPENATRGDGLNVSVTVTNSGDVAGTETVTLAARDGNASSSRSVELEGGASKRLTLGVETENRTLGAHNYTVSTATTETAFPVTIRDTYFVVDRLRGPEVMSPAETVTFSARVRNTGTMAGEATIEHRIDSDSDDIPEAYGINRTVTLAPGEATRVTVDVTYTVTDLREHPVEPLEMRTYVHGIYSDDSRTTTALSVEPSWSFASGGSGSASSGSTDGDAVAEPATLDQITQDKYGLFFKEVSSETQRQVREIHERQPFADGLVTTEVRTREEIARSEHGVDIESGEPFEFSELNRSLQQRIEADFDAQFQTEDGDRIESLDELAQAEYGADYEQLSDEEKAEIDISYESQFD